MLHFKIASEPDELEQIHRLNYRTFAEEIPQHAPNRDQMLVDRFDAQNTYVICRRGDQVIGMIAFRGERPFSLDEKLPDLDEHLPPARSVCEIRLLAVERQDRTGVVFRGLVACLAEHCLRAGHDLAVMSGTVRQLRLYRHIGFVPFGPLVGTPDALFQPMYLTLETFRERGQAFVRLHETQAPVSFLPGPVEIAPEVWRAMTMPPVSHRGRLFVSEVGALRRKLVALTGARHVQLMLGSGTLANDAVAAQLSLLGTPGLVLSNGEFGDRLVDHASRAGLSPIVLRQDWGSVFDRASVEAALDAAPVAGWLWAVHCETSTGILNDLRMLREVCAARGIRFVADCISSLGSVPVDLDGVYLATGASGKGLGSLPGIAMVFHHHELRPSKSLPRYLDLGLYAASDSVPFTHSSNLIRALDAAVSNRPLATVAGDAERLRSLLRGRGFRILAPDEAASPAVTTIVLPLAVDSGVYGAAAERAGYLISCQSGYLRARNWVQICLMGNYRRDRLDHLVEVLDEVRGRSAARTAVA